MITSLKIVICLTNKRNTVIYELVLRLKKTVPLEHSKCVVFNYVNRMCKISIRKENE
jgi:hypothetical protein